MSYHVDTVTLKRSMKMSPCHCFRSFVLYFVTLSLIIETKVNAFAIRKTYNATNESLQDLTEAASLQLEVRHDLNGPNGINENITNKSYELPTTVTNGYYVPTSTYSKPETTLRLTETMYNPNTRSDITTARSVFNDPTPLDVRVKSPEILKREKIVERIFPQSLTNHKLTPGSMRATDNDNSKTIPVGDIEVVDSSPYKQSTISYEANVKTDVAQPDQNVLMSMNMQSTLWPDIENGTDIPTSISSKNNETKGSSPSWKKYTVIERKRVTRTDESATSTEKGEDMVKGETRITLMDSLTSDIPSLEGVKRDVPLSTKPMSVFEYSSSTPNYQDISQTLMEMLTKPDEITTKKIKLESMSSKRAGFLNYSSKSKQNKATTSKIDSTSYSDYTTPILSPDLEEISTPDTNIAGGAGSQTYLNEDAIKEELLQETSLNDYEEIARNRQGLYNDADTTLSTTEQYSSTPESTRDSEWTQQTDVTNTENIFNVKPIQDKGKSTNVYTVSSNYKPMKKIEVQPPKPFVRDPDDNSWRNESISSLGIVFKPKNSSKPFTQVLKNKTETEWSNVLSKDSKSDVPDLRVRLEKIAQKRKSKKNQADLFGNIIYTDYEENNSSEEMTSTQKTDFTSPVFSLLEFTTTTNQIVAASNALSTPSISTSPIMSTTTINATTATDTTIEPYVTTNPTLPTTQSETPSQDLTTTPQTPFHKKVKYPSSTIERGKKYFNVLDYYDISDENQSEYLKLAKLELKKFTVPFHETDTPFASSPPLPYPFTKPFMQYVPERKPTIQYFPPQNIHETKSYRYDDDFERKIKSNMMKTSPKNVLSVTSTQEPDTQFKKYYTGYTEERNYLKSDHNLSPVELPGVYKSNGMNKNLYLSVPPRTTTEHNRQNSAYGVGAHNEGFNRASFVIKNYKDFLDQAAKDYDYEREVDFVTYTETPVRGVTISDLIAQTKDKVKTNVNENDDYDAKFRKDVLQRFVDNFNHNDARYNTNFPVLYNNSVMHVNMAEHGEAAASSRSFLKGLYDPSDAKYGYARREPYDPNCDNVTVELSPAYELQYYVPEQEEKEELEPKPVVT